MNIGGIDSSVNPVAPGCDTPIDQCPPGSVALYCRHFEFSNLHYHFSIFVLNVLEYYRVSFGQLYPHGVSRVLHFEVLCCALGYDPTMLMFLMSALDFIKSDDTSDVVLGDVKASVGEDAITRIAECRLVPGGKYVSVPNFKGFTKVSSSKPSTHYSSCRLKGPSQSSATDHVDLSNDIEISGEQGVEVEAKKDKELTVVVGKKGKSDGKKVVVSAGNAGEIYIPNWHVKVGDSFKSSAICEDVLNNFSPPMVRGSISAMEDDMLISRMMLRASNLAAMLPEGVSRFRKRMHEYKEFSKNKDKTKASMAAMKKEIDGFAEKEKAWVMKVHELTSRHEVELDDLKKKLEADRLQLKADRETLNVQQKAFLDEKEGLKASLSRATGDNQWLMNMGSNR
ncbi:hypothetical protein HanRHA438_Chr16g0764591 [Helianthus annuus]|uniref:Transposase (Putative), gypsy type n=1 Tax=Helianthus annuus TaxID=4232 RepID=A0A9K3DTW7_HELAN|nr:hypothetical protein HanXRQr2_Chr16g0752691 [Helianthus annuus]KAJ0438431.1 hypothetical protein HanHA300_Chr16g0613971 [Helianthus annuus]KAJ0443181.1 hypothetical protein HanIR_Chr16g0817961 [Helianthus annuus]KAJ0460755.1 hypothetical protein HanHA89_Chr16g0664551 [Helianthus annuus]KAJ0645084.1 hypothetical protein HanOQP8_Chr16g0619931 [Helianthus annuus]